MLFKNGKIFKIFSEETKKCFICYCTDETLTQIGFDNRYSTSFKIIDSDVHEIVFIENYPYDSEDDLIKRADYWMHPLNCVNKENKTYL
jgi:hypothetical protein